MWEFLRWRIYLIICFAFCASLFKLIVILTTFQPLYSLTFFRCRLSYSQSFWEFRTEPFQSTRIAIILLSIIRNCFISINIHQSYSSWLFTFRLDLISYLPVFLKWGIVIIIHFSIWTKMCNLYDSKANRTDVYLSILIH